MRLVLVLVLVVQLQQLSNIELQQDCQHGTQQTSLRHSSSMSSCADPSCITCRRNHGKLLLDQVQVDEWCAAFAEKHYMAVSDTEYAAIPREVRGVPHLTIPGLHSYLDTYTAAMERTSEWLGRGSEPAVPNLQCLPFGPYSERLPTHVAEGATLTSAARFRNPSDALGADGRAFQVDSTLAEVSILREPFLSRPGVTAPSDNPFGQAQFYVTTFFGAAATLAQLARSEYLCHTGTSASVSQPREEVAFLRQLLRSFHNVTTTSTTPCKLPLGATYRTAAEACVVLNAMYPKDVLINSPVIHEAYARAPARMHTTAGDQTLPGLFAGNNAQEDEWLMEAQEYWTRFDRSAAERGAWCELAPLLELLLERDGTFDNSVADIDAMAAALERAIRGVWCVHSEDGARAPLEPSPLAGVRSPTMIMPEHLNPVFVGRDGEDGNYVHARGSVIGLMPMGWQQLLALLMGYDCVSDVVIQYKRNEGQLCYRASSAPDILTQGGKDRTSKACSCIGVDGDEAAFGTRKDKLIMCKLQRAAFAANLDLVKPLCLNISKPETKKRRGRGCRVAIEYMKEKRIAYSKAHTHTQQELDASKLFAECAAQVVTRGE